MKRFTFLMLILFISQILIAQTEKRPLSLEDVQDWKRITKTELSNDGENIAYILKPWKGDTELVITTKTGEEKQRITGAYYPQFTKGSDYLLFKIAPLEEKMRELKLKKTKKDKMPLDQLGIYNVKSNKLETIDRLKSFKMAEKLDGWMAYQIKPMKKEKKKIEEKEKEKELIERNVTIIKEKEGKEESDKNGFTLTVRNVKTGKTFTKPYVTQYFFAEEYEYLVFITKGKEKDILPGMYRFNLKTNQQNKIHSADGTYKRVSLKKDGSMIAFLHDTTTKAKDAKNFDLYFWNGSEEAKVIVDSGTQGINDGWDVSPNKKITFAEKTNRIFFGTAPKQPEEDTTILKEEIPVVDVWHYNEPVLQTVQIVNKKKDLKKAYEAVYFMDSNKTVTFGDPKFSGISVADQGDGNYAIAVSDLPYGVQSMWEPYPRHNDFYLVDIDSGKAKKIKTDCRATPRISPEGKYIYWYNAMDTSWNTYEPVSGKEFKLSTADIIQIADEMNDIPNPPSSYGIVGWAKDDKALFVYDRYDIWKLDPQNNAKPLRITTDGKEKSIEYRVISFNNKEDWGKEGIDISKPIYLFGHNNVTREDGYYKAVLKKAKNPKMLIVGEFMLPKNPKLAKDENVVIYTKQDFETFPNILVTDLSFENATIVTDANPQQDKFIWGTAELYTWASLDGKILNGTLHKPENFDPNKKYPLIVNFYEKNSQRLYSYRMPENNRSTVDYHYYTSNGYIVFNPDVFYKTGYPGEDAFNCVMPGITTLIAEGYIDEKAIGAQGHSWGGYQVAYMATRTNMFAAIESGAPVVNMFSAYGGIRWNTGLNRSFQYEHTQSRIGKTIWESPLRYIENSPIFTMDKVNTPILIMANDDDGYVPWWQGIEYFIALRRMGKPAWLLNYNDADHWPLKQRDKFDFQVRMAQFFDHYLKGKPMPKWMKEGIPAVKKGKELGYELVE